MSAKENLTERLTIAFTTAQMAKIEKLSSSNVLSTATFARQQLVKTLKLKIG